MSDQPIASQPRITELHDNMVCVITDERGEFLRITEDEANALSSFTPLIHRCTEDCADNWPGMKNVYHFPPDVTWTRIRDALRALNAPKDSAALSARCLGCEGGSVHHTCGKEPDADRALSADALRKEAVGRGALTDNQLLQRIEHIRRELPRRMEPETAQAIDHIMRSHDVLWSYLSTPLAFENDARRVGLAVKEIRSGLERLTDDELAEVYCRVMPWPKDHPVEGEYNDQQVGSMTRELFEEVLHFARCKLSERKSSVAAASTTAEG